MCLISFFYGEAMDKELLEKYLEYVLSYGHIALFSGYLDVDVLDIKSCAEKHNINIIAQCLNKAIEINTKYDEINSQNEIIQTIFLDFSSIDDEIMLHKEEILQKITKISL